MLSHNQQVWQFGKCGCPCHEGPGKCGCGWTEFPERKSRKPRKVNLESRVKSFNRTRNLHLIAVSKEHRTHQPRVVGGGYGG